MPVTPTYPGVYIQEIPSGVRTIVGVATSITAFIGRARRGPVNKAETINSYGDFERIFGGLWVKSTLGYAVRDFYQNDGSQAIIVRLFHTHAVTPEEQAKADAAQAVVTATAGADVAAAKKAANDKAKEYEATTAAEKDAAKKVSDDVDEAAKKAGATVNDLQAAAKNAAAAYALSGTKSKLAAGDIKLEAAEEGAWGANLRTKVDLDNIPKSSPDLFNLTVQDVGPGGASERFLNLSITADSPRCVERALKESKLVRWDGKWPPDTLPDLGKIRTAMEALQNEKDLTKVPAKEDALWDLTLDPVSIAEKEYARAKRDREGKQNGGAGEQDITKAKEEEKAKKKALDAAIKAAADAVSDGEALTINDFLPPKGETEKKGLYALEQADLFNLLCIPPYNEVDSKPDVDVNLISAAATYCEKRRAMLLVDSPKDWTDKSKAKEKFTATDEDHVGTRSANAALFFPRIKQQNPLLDNQMQEFVPCGVVAGVFARTDVQRGVWKAPAGQDAVLKGVSKLAVNLTDAEQGELNPLGINCLRAFPIYGLTVWGSRTLRGADQLADEYKYIAVRRFALFLEESLYRGLKWVVFEPNAEPLWAQIRLNVGAFMHDLFRQGAFKGMTPQEAYFVKCNGETTTPNDINLGIVNIVVGFAPLKPAEFVIVKIQQMAGQIQV